MSQEAAGSDIYIGLMSGTSLDGIDVVISDFSDFPPRLLYSGTDPYPPSIRERLHQLCQADNIAVDELYQLDAELGELYASSVNRALELTSLDRKRITAIGCHGQTIRHSPDSTPAYTAQIGDPNRLAALCGVTTVADFRRKDIALKGQAAPLAPAFHQFLFGSRHEHRVVINIGGIANITYLPAGNQKGILGFDTGPGNTLCDSWIKRQRGQDFDDSGAWARSGTSIPGLLAEMIDSEPYFSQAHPKSTGTETFNSRWLAGFLAENQRPEDVQATLVELTATTIAQAISQLPTSVPECFVCGGGAHNSYLLERLAKNLPKSQISTTSKLGLNPDFVEAAAFAWLARERINLRCASLPQVTKAQHAAILGGIYEA